jgi:hypothetical protein
MSAGRCCDLENGSADGQHCPFRVTDAQGNVGTGMCNVSVPHDQGGASTAVDSGVHVTIGTCL